jgi:hypothetical protein
MSKAPKDPAPPIEIDREALAREVAERSVPQLLRRIEDLQRMLGENRFCVRERNLPLYEAELPLCLAAVLADVEDRTGLVFMRDERRFLDRETGELMRPADVAALWGLSA